MGQKTAFGPEALLALGAFALCALFRGGHGGSSASSAPATGPANATRGRRTASRPTTSATPQAIAKTRATLNAARAGDPIAKAAVNAAVATALKEQGIQLDGPASAAQQQALRTSGNAVPEFTFPSGGPVPVPPPGGAANDNAHAVDPVPRSPVTQAADERVKAFLEQQGKPAASAGRTPKKAATDLQAFLLKTGRFGTLKDRPQEVRDAQRDMGLEPDGIVGPKTRKTSQVWGVTLPPLNPATKVAARPAANSGKKKV